MDINELFENEVLAECDHTHSRINTFYKWQASDHQSHVQVAEEHHNATVLDSHVLAWAWGFDDIPF